VIEAVAGLNQALVDGSVEPDRWILSRTDGTILSHRPGERNVRMVAVAEGVELRRSSEAAATLLSEEQVQAVYALTRKVEELFGTPQDVEWTFRGGDLTVLQSRPITTGQAAAGGAEKGTGAGPSPGGPGVPSGGDRRSWYLSLRRSFENLKDLRARVEDRLIPEMIAESEAMAGLDLRRLSEDELAEEICRRRDRHDHWVKVYWEEFIPFAHGVRLFGRLYNDRLQPRDPFEFVEVLRPATLESLERNRLLERLAALVRRDPQLAARLASASPEEIEHPEFRSLLNAFFTRAGNLSLLGASEDSTQGPVLSQALAKLLLEMAASSSAVRHRRPAAARTRKAQAFLESFSPDQRAQARELLDLGRSSYRLRDDDNLYLGRIERELWRAVGEGRERLGKTPGGRGRLASSLQAVHYPQEKPEQLPVSAFGQKDRQLVGQPAGDGLATGVARVVLETKDLFAFKRGEILVCDALDPNMTFVIPLAAAVVERRGGMLIHGAIIAREYGLPCVTGIPELTSRVPNGARITVDGYLGIVVLHDDEAVPHSQRLDTKGRRG
jgi:phosphohistidine swiveling domain-containing protein